MWLLALKKGVIWTEKLINDQWRASVYEACADQLNLIRYEINSELINARQHVSCSWLHKLPDVYKYYWYYSISFLNISSQKANITWTFVKRTQGQIWLNLNVTRRVLLETKVVTPSPKCHWIEANVFYRKMRS